MFFFNIDKKLINNLYKKKYKKVWGIQKIGNKYLMVYWSSSNLLTTEIF